MTSVGSETVKLPTKNGLDREVKHAAVICRTGRVLIVKHFSSCDFKVPVAAVLIGFGDI